MNQKMGESGSGKGTQGERELDCVGITAGKMAVKRIWDQGGRRRG